jgi:hypothetical protein
MRPQVTISGHFLQRSHLALIQRRWTDSGESAGAFALSGGRAFSERRVALRQAFVSRPDGSGSGSNQIARTGKSLDRINSSPEEFNHRANGYRCQACRACSSKVVISRSSMLMISMGTPAARYSASPRRASLRISRRFLGLLASNQTCTQNAGTNVETFSGSSPSIARNTASPYQKRHPGAGKMNRGVNERGERWFTSGQSVARRHVEFSPRQLRAA